MDIYTVTAFFGWYTLINAALLLLWTTMCIMAPDLVYRTQTKWFPMSRETQNLAMYSFLGLFKIFFLVFNLIHWLALLIIG